MSNIFPNYDQILSRTYHELLLNQKGKVLWFTGLSGSGKSTIAIKLQKMLYSAGYHTTLLDGDNIRHRLNGDLGFSLEDRKENIRRIAEVARLFLDIGTITLCTFVSPTKEIRALARHIIGKDDFLEIYIDTPVDECILRDTKGLYKKAQEGLIKNMTGIDSPFEPPIDPDIVIYTIGSTPESCARKIFDFLLEEQASRYLKKENQR